MFQKVYDYVMMHKLAVFGVSVAVVVVALLVNC